MKTVHRKCVGRGTAELRWTPAIILLKSVTVQGKKLRPKINGMSQAGLDLGVPGAAGPVVLSCKHGSKLEQLGMTSQRMMALLTTK